MSALGGTQVTVLDTLASWPFDSPPTCAELVDHINLGRPRGLPLLITTGTANGSLRGLEKRHVHVPAPLEEAS